MSHATAPKSAAPAAAAAAYDRDLYAWSQEQADLLLSGRLGAIDALNIAEEIADVGHSEYDKLESALVVLLAHMLKWDRQPKRRSRSWESTILEQRARVERQLRKNPSLRSRLDEAVADGYRLGRIRAFGETDLDISRFPETCPYDWKAIMRRAFNRS